jgi:APA family basic amino acid/polyamine antiporter
MSNQSAERQELNKVMGIWDYFTMGFGAMVGVGWVITVGSWITKAGGPVGAIIAFILGGLVLIPVAFAYAELSSSMPVAGGDMVFAYRAYGLKGAFIAGWAVLLGYIIICPWEAVSIGGIFGEIVPALKFGTLYNVGGYDIQWPILLFNIVVSFIIIYINVIGADKTAKFQNFMTNLLLGCAGLMIVLGIFHGAKTGFANLIPVWTDPDTYLHNGISKISGMISIFVIAPFFFAGFDIIPQAAEEAGDETVSAKLGKIIVSVVISGAVFYGLCILSVACMYPWQDLDKLDFPAATALTLIAPKLSKLVLIGALAGLISTYNGFYMSSTRLMFALGRSRLIPEWFAVVHPQYKTPVNAVKFVAVISLIGPFLGKAILLPAVNVGTLAFLVAWGMASFGTTKIRKNEPKMQRPYQMPGGPVCGYLALIVCIFIIGILLIPGSPGALVWPLEHLVAIIWAVLGAIFFAASAGKRAEVSEEERRYLIYGDAVKTSD